MNDPRLLEYKRIGNRSYAIIINDDGEKQYRSRSSYMYGSEYNAQIKDYTTLDDFIDAIRLGT